MNFFDKESKSEKMRGGGAVGGERGVIFFTK